MAILAGRVPGRVQRGAVRRGPVLVAAGRCWSRRVGVGRVGMVSTTPGVLLFWLVRCVLVGPMILSSRLRCAGRVGPASVQVRGQDGGVGVDERHELDVEACRRWVALALGRLEHCAAALDALNVFPVPDGDTGTNLLLTFRRAAQEARTAAGRLGPLSAALARGALLGARGNSGIITAQMLRACAETFVDAGELVGGRLLAAALRRADEQAWQAVSMPLEGTVLSATRAVSVALAAEPTPRDALRVADVAAAAAREALARTPSQLPPLADAGVVDAGAAGFVLLLEALVEALGGRAITPLPGVDDQVAGIRVGDCQGPEGSAPEHASEQHEQHVDAHLRPEYKGPGFEVMYLLAGRNGAGETLRARLARLGDSVVVVGGAAIAPKASARTRSGTPVEAHQQWRVHVHTDDPAAALAAGRALGSLSEVRAVHLDTGSAHLATGSAHLTPGSAASTPARVPSSLQRTEPHSSELLGCVAWASGPGLAGLLADAGAMPVVSTQARRISTEEVLAAIEATGARKVVVLPNDADSVPVVRAAVADARAAGLDARIVETVAEVQGLAAVAVFDPFGDLDEVVAGMAVAAQGTRHAAVALASRAASTPVGPCEPGNAVAVIGGEIACIASALDDLTARVVADLLPGAELVTLVLGVGAGAEVEAAVRKVAGSAQVQVIAGGQYTYPVLIGVE